MTYATRFAIWPILVLVFVAANPSLAAGQAVGIDFVGTGTPSGASDTAGVIAKSHWNNATGARSTSPLALVNETGAATGATVSWTADNTWATPITDTAGNRRMMRGYLDTPNQHATTVTVAGLAAGTYDVYVYVDGDNANITRSASYQLSGAGITTTAVTLTDAANTNFGGTFSQANNSAGNYVKFSINARGFTLTATPGTSSNGNLRAPVNGLQIIPTGSPAPDFTIAATPASRSVSAGAAATYTVTVGGTGGFSGSVTLGASGLPANTTATFSPNPVAAGGSATLTLQSAASTPSGNSTITVNGVSGSLTHSTAVTLTVTAPPPSPDFSVSISPASQSTTAGGTVNYTVSVAALNGFSGTVSFNVSGLPPNASPTFTPASVSGGGTSTLKVSTTAGTPQGSSTLTVTATSGATTHSATASLNVGSGLSIGVDFVGTGTASGASDTAGVIAKSHWNNATGARSTNPLALVNETGAATGATVAWVADNTWATSITDTAGDRRMMRGYLDTGSEHATTVTVAGLAAGPYDIYVYVDGDNGTATRAGSYQISGAGISTTALSLTDAANTNFSGTFNQANNSAGNYVRFSITASGFTLTATPGTSSSGGKRAPVNGLQIIPTAPATPDFTIAAAPATQTVSPGAAAAYTVTVGSTGGFAGQVTLGATGLPANTTATFSPNPVTAGGSATFTVQSAASTPDGTSTVTVSGTAGSLSHSAPVTFVVKTIPLYAISGSITPTPAGAGATVNLSGKSTGSTTSAGDGTYSFTGLAAGSYSVLPTKAGYVFQPASRPVTLNANATGVNFTIDATHAISGTISPASSGNGATVALSGPSLNTSVQADTNGQYLFTGLPDGTYTVTPTRTAYSFTPASKNVTLNGADAGGVDFTGALASNVIFFDDFLGSTIDTGQWTVMNREGDQSNSEVQCYTPANATATGGNLQITTQVQPSTCSGHSYNYTSAMLQWTTFNFTYGTIEIRAKMAGGQGTWPALWLLGANCQASNINSAENVAPCSWPNVGSDEIDMTEIKGGALTTVWQNVISGSSGFQTCKPTTSDVSQNWHTYGLVWAPGSLTWTIDGVQTCKFTSQIPSTPMFLMINTAVGGGGGGTVNDATLPQTLLVDYVKVSK